MQTITAKNNLVGKLDHLLVAQGLPELTGFVISPRRSATFNASRFDLVHNSGHIEVGKLGLIRFPIAHIKRMQSCDPP